MKLDIKLRDPMVSNVDRSVRKKYEFQGRIAKRIKELTKAKISIERFSISL